MCINRRAYKTIATIILFVNVLAPAVRAQASACDQSAAANAEAEAGDLKTWQEIFESFKRYSPCDDGAIAEGYSDSVVGMLADRWEQLSHMQALIAQNYRFRGFVLHHI